MIVFAGPGAGKVSVLRNGPTVVSVPDDKDKFNRKLRATDAAFRAQAIVVNEVEVGSIAALRLDRPTGPVRFITADGFTGTPQIGHGESISQGWSRNCQAERRNKKAMFDPAFMDCLREFGQHKAGLTSGDGPWFTLDEIKLPQTGQSGKGEAGQ